MAYKEVTETTVTYPDLDEQDKQDLRDNPVDSSELDRCTYQEDEIEFLEEEVLNVT